MKNIWRHFVRNKTLVGINLVGLTLALTVVLFIYMYVSDELSYDKWMSGHDRIVRIHPQVTRGEEQQSWATSEGFVIPSMASAYPEIEAATRVLRYDQEMLIKKDGEQIALNGIIATDSTFFRVFPMEFVYGNADVASSRAGGIVITESISQMLFGDIDPVGKAVSADFGDVTIKAVVKDVPASTHFHFKVVVPLKYWWPDSEQSRNMYAFHSYLKLKRDVDVASFNERVIAPWYSKFGYAGNKPASERRQSVELTTMPIADIHLQSHREKEFEANGNAQIVYVFISAGLLLLVIAVINYINLSNAIAIRRAKEVAVRKTIGASKGRLFARFMSESFVFTSIAVIASVTITALLLPTFNSFVGKSTSMDVLANSSFVLASVVSWVVISLLSGIYPASILSSYDPITILKSGGGAIKISEPVGFLKYGLLVAQFTISAIMIIVSSVIGDQLTFIENRDIGFDKNNVVVLQIPGEAREKVAAIKSELERVQGVSSVSAASVVPGKRVVILIVRIPDAAGTRAGGDKADDGTREMRTISADADFVKTLGLKLIDGRDFNSLPSDSNAFIVNEAAVRAYNLQDPVGRPFEYTFYDNKKGKIVGVVQDFNFASVHSSIEPVVIHIYPGMYNSLCVRMNGAESAETIKKIEATWKSVTQAPFAYQYLDVTYDALYKTEQTTTKVVSGFMTISMLIAGLGLFGIMTLFAQQRLKEIGIRKVMGASEFSLMNILSREYLLVVVVGNLLAAYPAFLVVNSWLEQFAFRVEPGVSPYVTSVLLSLTLAIVSTGWIVLKTARVNPVSILKYE